MVAYLGQFEVAHSHHARLHEGEHLRDIHARTETEIEANGVKG